MNNRVFSDVFAVGIPAAEYVALAEAILGQGCVEAIVHELRLYYLARNRHKRYLMRCFIRLSIVRKVGLISDLIGINNNHERLGKYGNLEVNRLYIVRLNADYCLTGYAIIRVHNNGYVNSRIFGRKILNRYLDVIFAVNLFNVSVKWNKIVLTARLSVTIVIRICAVFCFNEIVNAVVVGICIGRICTVCVLLSYRETVAVGVSLCDINYLGKRLFEV